LCASVSLPNINVRILRPPCNYFVWIHVQQCHWTGVPI
jgi:hypothetical protein